MFMLVAAWKLQAAGLGAAVVFMRVVQRKDAVCTAAHDSAIVTVASVSSGTL